jgi:hypothetical protein
MVFLWDESILLVDNEVMPVSTQGINFKGWDLWVVCFPLLYYKTRAQSILLLATDATDKAPRQILSFPQNILI